MYESPGADIVRADHAEKLHELPDEYFTDVLPAAKKIAIALGAENYNLLQVSGGSPCLILIHSDALHPAIEQRPDRPPGGRPRPLSCHPQARSIRHRGPRRRLASTEAFDGRAEEASRGARVEAVNLGDHAYSKVYSRDARWMEPVRHRVQGVSLYHAVSEVR